MGSKVGEGSTFHFIVQLGICHAHPAESMRLGADATVTPRPAQLHPRPCLEGIGGLRVLLAEDNPVNQVLATRLLEKAGLTVTAVSDGRDALLALEKNRFDVVLMDVEMPHINGFQVTEEVRKNEQTSGEHIPIIALTAHAINSDRERCLAAGMDGYLTKPIAWTDLYATVARVVRKAKAGPPGGDPQVRDATNQDLSSHVV